MPRQPLPPSKLFFLHGFFCGMIACLDNVSATPTEIRDALDLENYRGTVVARLPLLPQEENECNAKT
jgi:hypothetical protein